MEAGKLLGRLRALAVRAFGRDGDLKVLALFAAFLLFQAVRPAVNKSASFMVPVSVASENPLCTVTGVDPAEVAVTLVGPQEALAALNQAGLAFSLVSRNPDFRARESVPLRAEDLSGAGRLRVAGVSPASAVVSFDRLGNWITTNYVATPRLVGSPLQSTARVVMPAALEVRAFGSMTRLEEFSRKGILLPTSPVDVEGKTQTFQTNVDIRIPPDSGITSLSPSNFPVTVEITPVQVRRPQGGAAAAPTLISEKEAAAAAAAEAPEEEPAAPPEPEEPGEPEDLLTPEEKQARAAADSDAAADEGE